MARIRTIKPAFFRHRRLFIAETETGLPLRIAFAGIWTVCDREGRFKWEPDEIKLDCLPYDDIDFLRVLDALAMHGFIVRYALNGREYGFVPGFSRHQVINNREGKSEIPSPPEGIENEGYLTRAPRVDDAWGTRHDPAQVEGKGREGKGREGNGRENEKEISGGADAQQNSDFGFFGKIIRLKMADYDAWKKTYHYIPDFDAELTAADCYYSENPPEGGKWFFKVSNWLKRAHEQHKPKPRFGL